MPTLMAYSDELLAVMKKLLIPAIHNGHVIGMRNYMYKNRATGMIQESCEFFCKDCNCVVAYFNGKETIITHFTEYRCDNSRNKENKIKPPSIYGLTE